MRSPRYATTLTLSVYRRMIWNRYQDYCTRIEEIDAEEVPADAELFHAVILQKMTEYRDWLKSQHDSL